ncbi:MAG: hypothetical protein FWD58_00250 [Firmicutes bacterium]|nr:hypothetical protein [Bacillota bacterium]
MKKILLLVTMAAIAFVMVACVLSFFEAAFPLWSVRGIKSGWFLCDPVGAGMLGAKTPFDKVGKTITVISTVTDGARVDWSIYAVVIIAYVAAVAVPLTGLVSIILLLVRKKLGKNNLGDGIGMVFLPILLMIFSGGKIWKNAGVAPGPLLPILLICGVAVVVCTALSLVNKEKRKS